MKTTEALEILKRHNEWRRGAEIEMEHPEILGIAIDVILREKQPKTKIIKFIFRLIAFPFYAGLSLIPTLRNYFFHLYLFVRYGGESIAYRKDFNPLTIQDSIEKIMKL